MYAGECILADFRSALKLGKHSCEHTHWPAEFENPLVSLNEIFVAIDFFQLVVTLLDRTGHLDLTDYPTTAKCRDAIAKLKSMEVTTFLSELLQPQAMQQYSRGPQAPNVVEKTRTYALSYPGIHVPCLACALYS